MIHGYTIKSETFLFVFLALLAAGVPSTSASQARFEEKFEYFDFVGHTQGQFDLSGPMDPNSMQMLQQSRERYWRVWNMWNYNCPNGTGTTVHSHGTRRTR